MKTLLRVLLVVLFAASTAAAAPILGTGGLRSIGPTYETPAVYWGGNSWDSDGPCNAGSLVSGTPCSLVPGAVDAAVASGQNPANPFVMAGSGLGYQTYTNADGSAPMDITFGNEGGLYDFTMLGEFTADWNVNEVGWYEVGNPQNRYTIFGASAAVGSTAQVFIPSNFGFYYLNTSGNGEMFFTQSQFNARGENGQQFAAFQRDDYTIIGTEDIFSNVTARNGWQPGSSDYDYNDVMFGFKKASVPEPGTLMLLGMGAVGALVTRRRKRA